MNKTELIDITAEDSGLARDDAAKVIDSMLMTVTDTLTKGEEIAIPGFGKFSAVQRAARTGEKRAVGRITDLYASLPSITGKLELEYEGELKGAETIARELIRAAIGRVFSKHFANVNFQPLIQWFELGGELKIPDVISTTERYRQLSKIQDIFEHIDKLGVSSRKDELHAAAAAEMILEGLWAHRRIGRSEERGFFAEKQQRPPETRETPSRQRRGYN